MSDLIEQPNQKPESPVPDVRPQSGPKKTFKDFLNQNKWPFWVIGGSLFVIAFLAFLIFRQNGPSAPTNSKVSVAIDAPTQVPSGHEIVYKVTLTNNESTSLNSIVLDMLYPQGFTYESSTPTASKLDGSEFNVPNLDPGQNVALMIKGIIVGNANENKSVGALMHYKFANFNSFFVAQTQIVSQITNSNIVLNFDGPTTNSVNQATTYVLTYSNASAVDLKNVQIKVGLPNNFTVSSATPALDDQSSFTVADLPPNQSANIQIVGMFKNSNPGDTQIFTAEAIGPDSSGNNVSLALQSYTVSITESPLVVAMKIVDSDQNSSKSTTPTVVSPGDSLSFEIDYKNAGTVALNGVKISTALTGQSFDYSSINAQNASINNNVVNWDASQVRTLQSLQPNQQGSLLFSIRINNPATHTPTTNLTVSAKSKISSQEYTGGFLSNESDLKIATVAALNGSIAYVSGASPLQSGKSTTYTVTLSIANSSNDLNNSVVTMNLPNILGFDMSSVSSLEQNNVKYDGNTKKLTWTAGTVSAYSGEFKALRKMSFNVTITPGPTDLGKPVVLVNNLALDAIDSFTTSEIKVSSQNVTTVSGNQGQTGIVQP